MNPKIEQNIKLYYAINFLSSCWFIIASWVFFVLMYMDGAALGWLEVISFAIGFLVEIPSGAIADYLGKKKTIVTGFFLMSIGVLAFLLADLTPAFLFIGNILIVGVGFPLISGSLEALSYDTMKDLDREEEYEKVAENTIRFQIAGLVLAALAGGFLYKLNPYLPWLANGIFFLAATILSLFLIEPKTDTHKFSWKGYLDQNFKGFKNLFSPKLKRFIIPMLLVNAVLFMFAAGIIRPIFGEHFGYNGETFSYLLSVSLFVSFLVSFMIGKIKKYLGVKKGFELILAVLGIIFTISYFTNNMVIGAVLTLLISVTETFNYTWTTVATNKEIESKDRATTLSTLQFIIQIPYILVAAVFGYLVESNTTPYFYLGVGVVCLVVLVVNLLIQKTK